MFTGSELMDSFEKALYMLPADIRSAAEQYRDSPAEEIRLRVGRVPTILICGEERALGRESTSAQELARVFERATGASLHTAAAAMAEGYLSYMGLRVGVCGTAVLREGEVSGFRRFSSLALRIARECRGACDGVMREMYRNGFENTLIISRPGGGKTTALREIIRSLSGAGTRLAVVDERNELSATDEAAAQFDLGAHSDVLIGVPKADGAMMLLRGMNPQVIAMDEITRERDIDAVSQIFGCGVGILASAHAADADELARRPLYRGLLDMKIFKYAVTISGGGDKRRYAAERI